MVVRQIDPLAELQTAAELLFKRLTLAIPTALASFIVGFLIIAVVLTAIASLVGAAAMGGEHPSALAAFLGAGALAISGSFLAIVMIIGFAQAIVIAAAEDAWNGREPDFSLALTRTVQASPKLLALFVLMLALAVIPFMLSFVLIGIPLLFALGFFMMFALPAAVVGGETATGAIASSFRIVRANLGPALVAYVGMVVAAVIGRIADTTLVHFPLIGLIAAFFIGGLTSAYAALVAVRFYELLRDPAQRV